ncbi:RelA/SpoT family protein [Sediminispirochaeta bajacaliforniensis]|uniref:RelA/SpoT family protein n=1 Tax=Sediminispirochaeta bajacaliforniensis TaxID=148 RepID=UPI00036C0821|nr:bifunctional (p)ppGpp synthetase/guanosine-3',5'-bis(diphosphate) 3'-pyrophosphohydrolase [Sediminispirochaeta bajacaliforniensis]
MLSRIEKFNTKLSRFPEKERQRILEAAAWAKELHKNQKRASGEPYFIHPLQVAEFLIDLGLDQEAIIAALLHDVLEDTDIELPELRKRFGKQIGALVDGVTKISIVKAKSKSVQEAETIRKMLFAMTRDIRVIIIKLADKYHNMSTLEYLTPEKRKAIATECLDIYAPLADRLGISWLKAELEDLALKHLNPSAWEYINQFVASKKTERANYLKKIERTLLKAAAAEKIDIEVMARAKHLYSIYLKMKRRKKDISEIYDLLGIRIICSTTGECYTLLGVVHKLWPPIEGRFKDYIAMPKANNYQSLHTTVMGFDGQLIEIQIRTREMHNLAEYGIAAHWVYKQDGSRSDAKSMQELPLINKLKRWDSSKTSSDSFLEEIKADLLKDSIYVFTPRGHIVELPKNATAIDFAYHIHTEVGNKTVGAKADGQIIPLNQPLKNTQVIEILTSNNAHPHVNWLRSVRTSRARLKIRHWLNQHEENLFIDKSIIAKKGPTKGEETVLKVPSSSSEKGTTIIKQVMDRARLAFKIGDEKNMMISIAHCCSPSPGDDIVGYVSRGRGIIVHKRSCPNLRHIGDIEERTIEVEWEAASPKTTRQFKVTSRMTSDLFSEIEGAVKKYQGHLIEGKLEEDMKGTLSGRFTMELEGRDDYKKVLKSLRTIPSIINIYPLD